MKNWSSTIQTATTSASDQTKSCYRINNEYIEVVPAIGYWGLWDWSKSCIKVPMVSASGGVYAFHHILRLKTNPSPNTYQMNPSATSSGSTKWTNPGYSFNSVLFSHSSGVYTAKVSLKLGIDGEMHTRYGRSRHYLQYSINNGSKTNIFNVAGSEDDYTGGTLDSRTSYNNGYSSGRTQGQNDVTGNPNGYGLYTKSQYDDNWSNGYNSGYSAGNSAGYSNGYNAGRGDPYKASGTLYMTNGCSASCGWQPNVVIIWWGNSSFAVYNYGTTNSNSLGNQEGTCTISVNGSGFSCAVKGNFLKRNATYVAYHN